MDHLSLDDVEEEVRVAAAAQEMSQAQRLVQTLQLFLDVWWRSAWWTPEMASIETDNDNCSQTSLLNKNLDIFLTVEHLL